MQHKTRKMTSKATRQKPRRKATVRTRRRRLLWAIFKWGGLSVLALGAIGAATLAILFWRYGSDPNLPRISELGDYRPKQVTRIVAADGSLLGEVYEERRRFVGLDEIADVMENAMIDAEDADFRSHKGLDFFGMLRALWVNVRSGETRQGASTITQQVVKTFLLSPDRTLKRKIQEMILARRLEGALTKDEILTLYLNQIYFGHGRYGVDEAARYFFDKRASELNVGEAALLAGLVQSPERLSPLKNAEAAKRRQIYVLEQMVRRGHLSEGEARKWAQEPIRVVRTEEEFVGVAPELVEIVKGELAERYGKDALPYLGKTVKTTIDPRLQEAARAALEKGLMEIDARHGYRGPDRKLKGRALERKRAELARETGGQAPRSGRVYEAIVVSVSDDNQEMLVDLGGWRGAVFLHGRLDARYNPDGKKPSERFAPDDLVRVRAAAQLGEPRTEGAQGALTLEQGPQGAVVVIDPKTRHVLAIVGGYGFRPGDFNRALRAKRQPGSSFKPILYAAAIDSGKFTAATIVNDAPEVYDLWKPKNYESDAFRGPIRLREALAHSINTVAIRVMHQIGPEPVIELAHAMGIREELPRELSLALGSGAVTPLELTNAFATFPAEGQYAPPQFVTHIGDEALEPQQPEEVLRPEVAYVMTSLLKSVVEEGTATRARRLGRVVAGKTGTSNDARDTWFMGYSPDLVVGVCVGFDDNRSVGRKESGGRAALPIWIEVMEAALRGKSQRTFRQPPGVVTARIDKATGKLAAPGQPAEQTLEEVFLEGTVPTEMAPAPGEVDPSTFVLDQMEMWNTDAKAPAPPATE